MAVAVDADQHEHVSGTLRERSDRALEVDWGCTTRGIRHFGQAIGRLGHFAKYPQAAASGKHRRGSKQRSIPASPASWLAV